MAISSQNEGFQPRAHWAPNTPLRRVLFRLRLLADLQTNTIYRGLRHQLRDFSGRLLDIGCGNSPFRHLLNSSRAEYQGIDVEAAASFGYHNPDTVYYDGKVIPFADNSFEMVLCTEVLEHVAEPTQFIGEMHRVLKPKGHALVTLPWSARFHYQPHDYHRYTPSMLQLLFASFQECSISPRGTDYSSMASKVVVAYARNLVRIKPCKIWDGIWIPFRLIAAFAGLPFLLTFLTLGHAGILFNLGSTDDPLGYTLVLKK